MMNSTEMSTPVTRGELAEVLLQVKQEHARDLREATSQLATRAELQTAIAPLATRAELDAAVARLATKAELAAAIAPLATKAELAAAIAPLATKAELQDAIQTAIAPLATKAELQDAKAELQHAIQTAIAPLATKAELDVWGGALVARIQHGEQRMDQLYGLVQQTQQQIQQTEQRLITELARHVSAALEAMQTQIKASVEPFQDLPGRVARLETAVFGPAPRARRTRRRSD